MFKFSHVTYIILYWISNGYKHCQLGAQLGVHQMSKKLR